MVQWARRHRGAEVWSGGGQQRGGRAALTAKVPGQCLRRGGAQAEVHILFLGGIYKSCTHSSGFTYLGARSCVFFLFSLSFLEA